MNWNGCEGKQMNPIYLEGMRSIKKTLNIASLKAEIQTQDFQNMNNHHITC
jgi:hypothetical protein